VFALLSAVTANAIAPRAGAATPTAAEDHSASTGGRAVDANPANAVSVPLLAVLDGGLAVQYERFVAPPRVSVATSLGARASGGHDFDTLEGSFGTEPRLWLIGKEPFSRFVGPAMVGPYLGFRLDVGITRVSQEGRFCGSSVAIAEALLLGVRFVFVRHVELTPNFGIGVRTEFDPSGRLAAWTRPELVRFGLAAGVLF
jgi:hypothetical protein